MRSIPELRSLRTRTRLTASSLTCASPTLAHTSAWNASVDASSATNAAAQAVVCSQRAAGNIAVSGNKPMGEKDMNPAKVSCHREHLVARALERCDPRFPRVAAQKRRASGSTLASTSVDLPRKVATILQEVASLGAGLGRANIANHKQPTGKPLISIPKCPVCPP